MRGILQSIKDCALPLAAVCILVWGGFAPGECATGSRQGEFSLWLCRERVEYREHAQDVGLDSSAAMENWVAEIEGIHHTGSLVMGVNAMIPLSEGEGEEEWTRFGTREQLNTLTYRWVRIDGFVGLPLSGRMSPFGGLSWSESRQDRTDFVLSGGPVDGHIREVVTSWWLLVGVRGEGDLPSSRWNWDYRLRCALPVAVDVKNSSLPGFDASEHEGFSIELKAGLVYSYTDELSVGFRIYGGRTHWEGSGWKLGGNVKWPQNDTDYIGGQVGASWRF
ncbi:MAG: hypothetical protein ACMUIS_02110 [bacterium]